MAVAAVVVGAVVLVVMWGWIDGGIADVEKRTAAHVEAVKLASGIVVGGGGLFALYLAARRQRTQELELEVRRGESAQRDRAQAHAEEVAAETRRDAEERRVTELYTKAADQLGSDRAPVRLAGLYALERLAQGNPDHRQTVVDVYCAYLRMPYTPPDDHSDTDDPRHRERREELQVRRTAQSILARHLRNNRTANVTPRSQGDTFWPGIHLQLDGAHLTGFALPDAHVDFIDLNRATLAGETVLKGLTCQLAFMQGAIFLGHTDLRGAEFTHTAWFSGATFGSVVWFHGDEFYRPARFGRHVSFQGCTFTATARFTGTAFGGSVDFRNITWASTPPADFHNAIVHNPDATSPEVGEEPSHWPEGWHPDTNSNPATLRQD
ncbi:pentapeptide repeat-containing protein [Actinosynnema sp. NPDC051121]